MSNAITGLSTKEAYDLSKLAYLNLHEIASDCDRIILIHKGEIVETGSHKQLIRKKGEYYNLYTNQFKAEAEDRILGNA